MEDILLIDFGSTFTKVTIVDLETLEIVGTSKAPTTIETDIMDGLKNALKQIPEPPGGWNFKRKLACSSAAGGLKMVASGLVKELTSEAARRAALGAGARLLKVFSYELTPEDITEIAALKPDIILLAGGTDGGNKEVLLKNAQALTALPFSIPVVVAGNRAAGAQAVEILKLRHAPVTLAQNVMPELNVLEVDSARAAIRDVFLQNIIHAKGLDKAEAFIEKVLMPTPAAVLEGAELLAKGYGSEVGLGELLIVDVGGATTDVHSLSKGDPTKPGVMLRGLPEPYAKRTVEGDLGMRYSSKALLEGQGRSWLERSGLDMQLIREQVQGYAENPWLIPGDHQSLEIDRALARCAVELAVERHVGTLEVVYTPFGATYVQHGKDLTALPVVVGTGGVIINDENPKDILEGAIFKEENPTLLKPQTPTFYVDTEYILAAMGLLREIDPLAALRLLKKYLKKLA